VFRTYRAEPAPVVGDNPTLGPVFLITGFTLIAASAWLVAASLRLRGFVEFLLAVYVVASAGVVVVVLALSPFELVTRAGVVVASAVFLAAAAAVWQWQGRPAAPSMRVAAAACRETLRDPVLTVLAIAVALALAYAAALAVATPPNDFDVLWYHLPRAAFWYQQRGVGYIEYANDTRLNENPPGAEILSTWAMTLEGSERFASVFQVVALAATVLAVLRIARLLGFDRRAAAFGALLFATLPVVVLQASLAGNDVVVTSFIVAVAAFLLSDTRHALWLGGLALALSVATKGTVLFAIPLLLAVAVVLVPRRRWPAVAVAGTLSIAVGGFWYVFNQVKAGGLTPSYEEGGVVELGSQPVSILAHMARIAIDAVDPAGSVGRDRYVYAIAALVLLVIGGVAALKAGSRAAVLAGLGAAALAVAPLAFTSVHVTLRRAYQHVLVGRGEEGLAFLGWSREATHASAFSSWYGPLGLLAFLVSVPLVIREIRRGALRTGTLVLVLAPLLTVPIVAATWGYSQWHGRFFMPAVALSAATWAVLLRVRALGWAMSAIAVVTLLLSFVHYSDKPAGFSVLEGRTGRSVWTASRIEIMTTFARELPPEGRVIERLERIVRDGETVALSVGGIEVSYQYFGADLDRRVVFVGENGEGLDATVDWLVVSRGRRVPVCAAGWRPVASGAEGWRVYRRIGLCPGASAAS